MVVGGAHHAIHALVVILMAVCTAEDISRLVIPAFEKLGPSWASCLDRHQVKKKQTFLNFNYIR